MPSLFQHLLLATEHSEFDAGAERLALALAHRCHLPLGCVLPMTSNPEFEAVAPELATRVDMQAAATIAKLHDIAQAQGVHLAMHARRGLEAYREIVDEARERHSELLIIRRRGQRSFLAKLLLGEMVSKVVAHAPCHVLVVPREAQMWSHRVLVAAEPGAEGERIVQLACEVAAECGLPLHVLSVCDDSDAARTQADRFVQSAVAQARQRGLQAEGEALAGKPVELILRTAQARGADLLVIGSRSHSGLSHVWIGGVAQKLIGLTSCPVLLAHPPQPPTSETP